METHEALLSKWVIEFKSTVEKEHCYAADVQP
jgi:hypothetical protein